MSNCTLIKGGPRVIKNLLRATFFMIPLGPVYMEVGDPR